MTTVPGPLPPERPTPAPPPEWPAPPGPPPGRPAPPERSPSPAPPIVPLVDPPATDLGQRLIDRRTLLLQGRLDREAATRLAAELMTLDATSSRPIDLLVTSPGGPVAEVLAVLDTIALLRAPVATTCLGVATGTAAVVVALGTGGRRAAPHARLSLRCEDLGPVEGRVDEVARALAEHEHTLAAVRDAVARATGLPRDVVEREMGAGAPMSAEEARAAGLVDEVAGRS